MIPAVAAALEPHAGALRGDLGAYCVNAGIFEELLRLEAEGDPRGPGLRRRLAATDSAWTLAEREHRLGLRSSPAFAILPAGPPVRAKSPRGARRRLTRAQRTKQRDRYKRVSAPALEEYAGPHLRRDPRAGLYRPLWLDHKRSCRRPAYCWGCARMLIPPGPRWRRRSEARWRRRRRGYLTVPEWLMERAAAMRSCREAVAIEDRACGAALVIPQSCHVRTCPDCESARQQRVIAAYRSALESVDGDRVSFLTLTVKNPPVDELQQGLHHLDRSLEKLRRRTIWRGGRCRDRTRCRMPWDPDKPRWRLPHPPVEGWLLTVEVTPGDHSWHPHAHVIMLADVIDQAELADTWEAITGDSRVVDIRRVRRYATAHTGGDLERALRELLKYAAKGSPLFLGERNGGKLLAELLVALRGRRLTRAGGAFRHLGLTEEEDPLEGEDLVLVYPADGDGDPYRVPRVCPLHGGLGSWRLAGFVPRLECEPAPDLRRPGRTVLAWRPGPAPPPA